MNEGLSESSQQNVVIYKNFAFNEGNKVTAKTKLILLSYCYFLCIFCPGMMTTHAEPINFDPANSNPD